VRSFFADDYLAYYLIAHIASLAFTDDAFENTRLTPEFPHKLKVPGRLRALPLRFKKSMWNTPIFRSTVQTVSGLRTYPKWPMHAYMTHAYEIYAYEMRRVRHYRPRGVKLSMRLSLPTPVMCRPLNASAHRPSTAPIPSSCHQASAASQTIPSDSFSISQRKSHSPDILSKYPGLASQKRYTEAMRCTKRG
jgi:hypothetical protein